jgi:glutamate-1-semialdehyde 2,1-aminomutase
MTLLVHYNDLEGTRRLFEKYPAQIGCFVVEPVPGTMGVIVPKEGYLAGLREVCDRHGALLLFDEVMSGFRVAWGGAQTLAGVRPDLTCLGKVIGGGLPVGAYGGPRKLMELISPAGKVYQAGTLSGNPLAMSAGIVTLEVLQEGESYATLEKTSAALAAGLGKAAAAAGVPLTINRVGSMLTPFFVRKAGGTVSNLDEAVACDTKAYGRFFQVMLENGVYPPPSQFEAWFVGLAHTADDIERTTEAAVKAFAALR